MSDSEIVIPEVVGKTIGAMRLILTGSTGETEVAIDFPDGTSFSSTSCTKLEVNAELYIGGVGEPEVLRRYGDT